MKIVCDNCATKYSIADEKVSGKVFKIRCKKCGHIVVVRGTGEGEAAQPAAPETNGASAEAAPQAAGPAPSQDQPQPAREAVWHLVIDREQVGPMTAEEVRDKFNAGQIDADSYAWKEGFDDWVKLATIDDFRDLAGKPKSSDDGGPTHKKSGADLFRNPPEDEASPSADLFNQAASATAQSAEAVKHSAPNAATMMATAGNEATEGYGGSSSSWSGRQPAAAADEAMMSAGAGGAPGLDVKAMTGARSENSVLFSLNNLQALATGGGPSAGPGPASSAPRPGYANSQTEGSGLIDIRAMAAQTLSANPYIVGNASKPDELPLVHEAPLFSPVAASVLLPTAEAPGMPKWVWGVVAGGGAIFVGMMVVLVMVLKSPPPQVVATGPGPGPGTTATGPGSTNTGPQNPAGGTPPGVTKPGTGDTSPGQVKSPVKETAPSGQTASDTDKPGRRHRGKDERTTKPGGKESTKERETATAPTPQPKVETPEVRPTKPKPAKPKDDLDALLDTASSGSGGKPKAEASKKDAPEQLSMDQIKSGLKSVNGAVQACKEQFKTPGTYFVKLTIGRNGRVSEASVPGKSGDPTADCVAKAVRGARFSEFTGDPQTISSYPFILR